MEINTTTIAKTKVRNTFSSVYNKARSGVVVYISDRGNSEVALLPVKMIKSEILKEKITPISKTSAFGLFKNIKDSVSYSRAIREDRFKRITSGRKSFNWY